MAEKTGFDEANAAEAAGALTEIADRGRLAAFGVAQPLLVTRRVQLERERLRLRTRRGPNDPRVAALDRAIALAAARIDEAEITTEILKVDTPAAPEQGGAIFGRVTENGHGRRDLVVSVLDPHGKVRGFGCTGQGGAFELSAPAGTGLALRVTDSDGARLWRDATTFELADGQVIRREIELTAAAPECPEPDDEPGGAPSTVKVPDLIDRSEAEALRLLRAAGLVPGERGTEEDPNRAGKVVSQSPEPGAEAAPGTAVEYVVAVEARITMPDLRRAPLEEALARIDELGLNAEEPTFSPSEEFEGRVIQHTPGPGEAVLPGATVTLLVGSAPRVTVPDLRELPLDVARRRLREADLAVGETSTVAQPDLVGRVVRHTPPPGARVAPGAQVNLVVGEEPQDEEERPTMPELEGRSLEEARKLLAELRLEPAEITFEPNRQRAGLVVRQSPPPGSIVPADVAIRLVVATGNARRDLRTVVVLAASDPSVAALELSPDQMMRALAANNVRSVDALARTADDDASTRDTFGLRRVADARRLRAALKRALARIG